MIIDRLYSFDVDKFKECTGKVVDLKRNKHTILKYSYTSRSGEQSVVNILVMLVSRKDIDKNLKYKKFIRHFQRKYISCGRIIFKDSAEWETFVMPSWLNTMDKET